MGVDGQHHAPTALPPGKTRYLLYRRLGRPQGRSGRVRKISPPPGFDPRTVQPVTTRYTDWAFPAHLIQRAFLNENNKVENFTERRGCIGPNLNPTTFSNHHNNEFRRNCLSSFGEDYLRGHRRKYMRVNEYTVSSTHGFVLCNLWKGQIKIQVVRMVVVVFLEVYQYWQFLLPENIVSIYVKYNYHDWGADWFIYQPFKLTFVWTN